MRAWRLGNDVNTDLIIPGRYNITTDPIKLGKAAFIEYRPEFVEQVQPGDLIVAGRNFGCGSSREHAPIALKASGVSVVIAESFARIFLRNSINIGLPIMVCKNLGDVEDGDEIEVNLKTGIIKVPSKGISLQGEPLPDFIQKIVNKGGLIPFLREKGYV
jgi:3-isopropylmalate dehydratase small subunit